MVRPLFKLSHCRIATAAPVTENVRGDVPITIGSNNPALVTLRLRCPECHGKIRLTYRPSIGSRTGIDIRNEYQCPCCRKTVHMEIPGLVRFPVETGHEDGF